MDKLRQFSLYILLLFLAGCTFDAPPIEVEVITGPALSDPDPSDGAEEEELALTLRWQSENIPKFDLYFGINRPPDVLYAADTTSKEITVVGLNYDTRYYWQVIGKLSDGSIVYGPIWNFKTRPKVLAPDGFIMQKQTIATEIPSYVNILFQVLDLNNEGYVSLTVNDFEVFEDDLLVSPEEAIVRLFKKEEIPYTFRTVLMLDNSTSLEDSLSYIRAAAIGLVNNLTDKQEVAVYKFSDEPELIQDFTSSKTSLIAAINSITTGYNTTDLYGAVIAGAAKWTDIYSTTNTLQGALVLFTDGQDTQGEHTFEEALTALGDKRCFTIGFGGDIDPAVLRIFGNSGFYSVNSTDELSQKFLDIQLQLDKAVNSYYVLNYLSPKRGDFSHTLKVYIKNNPYSGSGSSIVGQFNSAPFYSVSPGLYINPSVENQTGISSLIIDQNTSVTVTAYSFLVNNQPVYTWTSGNNTIATVTPDATDNSVAVIKAVGNPGDQTTIVVLDFNNDLSKLINITVQ